MSYEETKKAHTYVLLNCEEVTSYVDEFDEIANQTYPNGSISHLRDEHFAEWFEKRVNTGLLDGSTKHLEILARHPLMSAKLYKGYFVNDTHTIDEMIDEEVGRFEVEQYEEEEFEDEEDTSDDYDNEILFSDHSSDEDEFD
ncbi:hypothetical protein QVD17_02798 [Tagetes erecta]|uniref:Uncharacterized protein n=1 Tax=Tagetes erecta TaxID=13708 RepID=A0AAD8P832_TARER|nr:hypothetical protein QVD17_38010 [Tagetes erecta]KAK1437013.1 hypothetical protein QVD17_02798 [Tagetes erecta]